MACMVTEAKAVNMVRRERIVQIMKDRTCVLT